MDRVIFSIYPGKPDFESAAFPNGLPESLGASVAFPPVNSLTHAQDPQSEDEDHGGMLPSITGAAPKRPY